jgi:hypothetical protein
MVRASNIERTHRVNLAREMLQKGRSTKQVRAILIRRFGIGSRQARRYLVEAVQHSAPVPAPEVKAVFTVKLPVGLIQRLRNLPRSRGCSLSEFVAQALGAAIQPRYHSRGNPDQEQSS